MENWIWGIIAGVSVLGLIIFILIIVYFTRKKKVASNRSAPIYSSAYQTQGPGSPVYPSQEPVSPPAYQPPLRR